MNSISEHIDHQTLIDIVIEKGIESISVLQESKSSIQSIRTNTGIDKTHSSSDWGSGFYITHGLKEAFYCTNEFNRSYSALISIADNLLAQEGKIEPNPRISEKPITIDITKNGPWKANPEEESKELMNYIYNLLGENTDYNFRVQIDAEILHKSLQSSYTGTITQKYNSALITIELFDKFNIRDNYLVTLLGGIDQEDLNYTIIENTIQDLMERYKALSNSRRIQFGTYPVIMSSDTTYSLIHESIGHGSEADQIISGDSFLHNKIGQKIGSSDLNIIDDPHIRSSGWSEFDDEGTKTKGTILVDDGFLIDHLHTRSTAKLMNTVTTGNARATSYLSPPEARQSNLYIEPRSYSKEELLEEIGSGIYLGPTLSASTSLYSGKYMIETQYGYEITNGELGDMIRPITVTGYSLESLSKIKAIGKDVKKQSSLCMKDNSKIMIGSVTPEMVVSEVYLS